jgi:hypothetical protein
VKRGILCACSMVRVSISRVLICCIELEKHGKGIGDLVSLTS